MNLNHLSLLIVSTTVVCSISVGVTGRSLPTEFSTHVSTGSSDATGSSGSTDNEDTTSGGPQTITEITDTTNTESNSSPVSFITSPQQSSGSSVSPVSSTTGPQSTTVTSPSSGGFDGGSFAGGIALGVGLLLITFVTYRCYVMRKNGQQNYKAM